MSRLVGRDHEVAEAGEALVRGEPVEFCGEAGVGKTALVRYLACEHPDSPLLEHVITLPGKPVDDLLQDLYVAFFIPEEHHVPGPGEREVALTEVEALLILDDLRVSEREVTTLLDALPSAAIMVTSRRQRFWEDWMRSTTLEGLPPDAALELVERQLGRPIEGEERAIARDVCTALEGFPWHLKRVAGLVRRRGLTVAELQAVLEGPGGSAEARLSERVMAALTAEQREALAWLRTLGCPVHERHLALMSELSNVHDVLESLRELGVLQAHSPVWSVVGWEDDGPLDAQDGERLDGALEHLSGWAYERRHRHDQLLEDEDLLVTVLHRGVAAGRRPREAVRLARVLETPLAMSGHWGRWEGVLRDGLAAADALHDERASAAFRNQRGVRALCLGEHRVARRELRRAADAHSREGDAAGLATAEHNLRLAGGRPAPRLAWRRLIPVRLRLPDTGGVVTDSGGARGVALGRSRALVAAGLAGVAALAVALSLRLGDAQQAVPVNAPLAQASPPRVVKAPSDAGSGRFVTLEGTVENRSQRALTIEAVGLPRDGKLVRAAVVRLPFFVLGVGGPRNVRVVGSRGSCRRGLRLEPDATCRVRVRARMSERRRTLHVVVRPRHGDDLEVSFSVPRADEKPTPGDIATPTSTPTPGVTATDTASATATPTPEDPQIEAQPESLRLSSVQWRPKTGVLRLTSEDPSVAVTASIDPPRAPFRLLNRCPREIGDGCALRIRYTPQRGARTAASAMLALSWSSGRRHDHVPLTGDVASLTPRTLRVPVPPEGAEVTLTNDGQISLTFEKPASAEGVEVDLGGCAEPVEPRRTCTLTLAAASRPEADGVPVYLGTDRGASVNLIVLPPEE